MTQKTGYSSLQIALHWVIAVLIFAAYFTSDGMGQALRARSESGASGIEGNTLHVWLGGAAFLLIVIRVVVRLRQGAPRHTEATPPMWQIAATWGHRLLYLLMLAVPAAGAAAWYGGLEPAGDAHELIGNALMLVAIGHIVAALAHEVMLGDGTLSRMFKPGA